MQMTCQNCGAINTRENNFCQNCGRPLSVNTVAGTVPAGHPYPAHGDGNPAGSPPGAVAPAPPAAPPGGAPIQPGAAVTIPAPGAGHPWMEVGAGGQSSPYAVPYGVPAPPPSRLPVGLIIGAVLVVLLIIAVVGVGAAVLLWPSSPEPVQAEGNPAPQPPADGGSTEPAPADGTGEEPATSGEEGTGAPPAGGDGQVVSNDTVAITPPPGWEVTVESDLITLVKPGEGLVTVFSQQFDTPVSADALFREIVGSVESEFPDVEVCDGPAPLEFGGITGSVSVLCYTFIPQGGEAFPAVHTVWLATNADETVVYLVEIFTSAGSFEQFAGEAVPVANTVQWQLR